MMTRCFLAGGVICLAVLLWGHNAIAQGVRAPHEAANVVVGDINDYDIVSPLIVAGDPTGTPPDTPSDRVDPNTTSSPFAGVGSFFVDAPPVGDYSGYLGSGSIIHGFGSGKTAVRDHVLTAAHMFDFNGGTDPGGDPTGDGTIDVSPSDVTFYLNFGGDLTHSFNAKKITLHPDWHGFGNTGGPEGESYNDDLAVIQLDSPVPAGVPICNVLEVDSGFVEVITSVGYGQTGDPSGYIPGSHSFNVKRIGLNQCDAVWTDDEGIGPYEVFLADFDGPDSSTNVFDIGDPGFQVGVEETLGNDKETTIGGGDSGSPSFLSDWYDFELQLGTDGNPIILGINTFGGTALASPPAFGSVYGGTFVPAYADWIDSIIVPEPSTLALLATGIAGLLFMTWRRRLVR